MKKILALISILALFVGCAERHKTADTGRSAEEIEEFIASLQSGANVQGAETPTAIAMAQDSSSAIFYAESNSSGTAPMGPLYAVADVDWDIFGFNIHQSQVKDLRVVFVERGTEYALIIQITTANGLETRGYINTASQTNLAPGDIQNDEFLVSFMVNGREVFLRSDDTEDNKLQSAIKLVVTSEDQGVETEHGQFSTLVGYF